MLCDIDGSHKIDPEEMEKMEDNEISAMDEKYGITKKTCMECRGEIRRNISEFEGDHPPMHPEETVEEFLEHEDHDPR